MVCLSSQKGDIQDKCFRPASRRGETWRNGGRYSSYTYFLLVCSRQPEQKNDDHLHVREKETGAWGTHNTAKRKPRVRICLSPLNSDESPLSNRPGRPRARVHDTLRTHKSKIRRNNKYWYRYNVDSTRTLSLHQHNHKIIFQALICREVTKATVPFIASQRKPVLSQRR